MPSLVFRLLCRVAIFSAPLWAEQLPIQVYTTADGLAHNHINCIRQDSRGFLWFCTDEGLTRFDGYRLTSYTVRQGLPHPWINDLIETRDGALWIASDGGVSRFNPRGGSGAVPLFTTYVPDQVPDARRVNALAEDPSGAIWCATYNGLYRLDRMNGEVKFQAVDVGLTGDPFEPRLVNQLAVDRRGWLWLGARTGLYRRFSDGRTERYTTRNGLPDNFISDLLEDRSGRWWAATRVGGFCQLAAQARASGRIVDRCFSTADGLPHNDVRSIFQSSDGQIWIGTILGLSEFTPGAPPGKLFHNYTTLNGLSEQQIYKIAEDRSGNLWLGTRRGGAMKMTRRGFVSYGERDGFRSGTTHHEIFETRDGELCVLTGTGSGGLVQRLDGQKFIATQINLPLPHRAAGIFLENGFQADTGEWWLATRQGLVRVPKTRRVADLARVRPKVYTTTDGLPANFIDYVYQGRKGDIWIAVTTGDFQILRWNRSTRTLDTYTVDRDGVRPPRSGLISAVAEDRAGNLWLGSRDCLVRCRAGKLEVPFTTARGIEGGIDALHLDQSGRLWVASTEGGLYRVDNPASVSPSLSRYTTAEGLSSNEILSLTEDEWGRIYAGSNRGVDRLDPKTGFVRHFTTADGLSRGAVGLAFRDHQGVLWFVADEGVSRLTPRRDQNPIPPAILIAGLRSMGVSHSVSALGETSLAGLQLAPGRNQLQIDFLGLDFRPGAMLRYEYKLEGADQEWSAPTMERTVNYASLAPGSYRFLVRGVTSDGVMSPRAAAVSFSVLAPVWRRAWFLMLCAIALSAILYGMHRVRINKLLALERIRMRIATDLHDDIGASLSHIAVLSEVVAGELGGPVAARENGNLREPLARIGSIARELVDSMSDIVWAISPRQDGLVSLSQRMREFAGEVLDSRSIEFHFQTAGIDRERKLDPDVRRQVFLIFKECIHNVVQHSTAARVDCDFCLQQRQLVLEVADNGRGFEDELGNGPRREGQGLESMRRRAEALGGTLILETTYGVKITVRVPIT